MYVLGELKTKQMFRLLTAPIQVITIWDISCIENARLTACETVWSETWNFVWTNGVFVLALLKICWFKSFSNRFYVFFFIFIHAFAHDGSSFDLLKFKFKFKYKIVLNASQCWHLWYFMLMSVKRYGSLWNHLTLSKTVSRDVWCWCLLIVFTILMQSC